MQNPKAEIIRHRVNNLDDLRNKVLNTPYGAEVDVRYHHDELILVHDPFFHQEQNVVTLNEYLKLWGNHRQTLILNLKTEGIEKKCFDLLNQYHTPSWFFLDMSTPFLIQYSLDKKDIKIPAKNLAVRWSEFESLELAIKLKDKISWVWVDCFTQYPDWDCAEFYDLKKQGLKFCLVAPELQSHSLDNANKILNKIKNMPYDAVCTKQVDMW